MNIWEQYEINEEEYNLIMEDFCEWLATIEPEWIDLIDDIIEEEQRNDRQQTKN